MTTETSSLRGLPGPLPEGERILWRGAPDTQALARRALHVRKLAVYFGILVATVGATLASNGHGGSEVAMTMLRAAGFSAIPIALAFAYAWLTRRNTVYTVTDRRVVLHIGIAVPVTINLPFARISGAEMSREKDGSGDICLTLTGRDKLAYLVLWPHARPWRIGRPQPTLRAIGDVDAVAQLLARALAASAEMAVPVLQPNPRGASVPHATVPA